MASSCRKSRYGTWIALSGLVIGLMWLATPLRSQEAPSGGVFTKVPADAIGFVHIKAGEFWKSEMFMGVRELLLKAGPPAVQAFNKRYAPAPGTIDSICIFATASTDDHPPIPAMIVTFTESFDATKVLKGLLPQGGSLTHFGQKYTSDAKLDVAIRALDAKTLLVTRSNHMTSILSQEAAADGPMKKHFKSAAGKTVYAAINVKAAPQDLLEQLPDPANQLSAAQEVVLSGQLAKDLTLNLRLQYADAASATLAETNAKASIKHARDKISQSIKEQETNLVAPEGKAAGIDDLPQTLNSLLSLAMLRTLDEMLQTVPIKADGSCLTAEYAFDPTSPKLMLYSTGMVAGLMMPTVEKTREAATRAKGQANLRQLAVAMHAHHDAHGYMPAAIFSKDGKKQLLSWRVSLLPYLGQKRLYDKFKRDEAWDSDHNKKLIEKMPVVFSDIDAPPTPEPYMTHYQIIVGPGAGFHFKSKDGTKYSDVLDGTSSTLMLVTAADPVKWTKPEEFELKKPLPKMGFGGKPPSVAFFDGSVRALKAGIGEGTLRALMTRAGGELIGEEY